MTLVKLAEHNIQEQLSLLNNGLDAKWSIVDSKLTKEFRFKNFIQAFSFMHDCFDYINQNNHHPEWLNIYNKLLVQLTTHDVRGISKKDFDLASQMEKVFSTN